MERVDSNIGNTKQPLYDGIQTENIYYLMFEDDPNDDDVFLPYGQEIIDQIQKKLMKHTWNIWINTLVSSNFTWQRLHYCPH